MGGMATREERGMDEVIFYIGCFLYVAYYI